MCMATKFRGLEVFIIKKKNIIRMNVIMVKESTVALWLIQLNYSLMILSTEVIIVSIRLNVEGIYMKTNNYLLISA